MTRHSAHTDLQYALDFHASCETALRDEIAAVRQQERAQAVAVRDGRRHPNQARDSTTTYAFRIRTGRPPHVSESVECHVPSLPPVRGTIREADAGRVAVALEADLGPWIAEATLCRDAAWLLESQRARVASLRAALERGGATAPYAPWAMTALLRGDFGYAPPAFVPLPMAASDSDDANLNAEQQDAVHRILTQPTTIVWGPPGTGKTRTIATAITKLVEHGQRVLVVTPSNTAADVLIAALQPLLAEHPLAGRGVVQRIGANITDHLSLDLRDLVVPARLATRLREELDVVRDYYEDERVVASARREAGTVSRLDAAIAALQSEHAEIPAEIARNSMVTVTPIANVHLRDAMWRSYDAVVVEEASMALLPELALAVGLSRCRVVIAGDWQQLGPVTVGRTPAVRDWLARDVFRAAEIPQRFASKDDQRAVVMLTEQYRMPRAVADLVGELFYLDRLRSSVSDRKTAPLPFADGALVLVDTSNLAPTLTPASRANPVHSAVVSAVAELVEQSRASEASRSLGIYALYRDQVADLRARVGAARCCVDRPPTTVHRAQGDEVDVVILDLSDAPPARPAALRAATWDSDGARLICVGLSRARHAIVVIAHVAHLQRTGGPMIRHVLSRIADRGEVIDARVLIRFAEQLAADAPRTEPARQIAA